MAGHLFGTSHQFPHSARTGNVNPSVPAKSVPEFITYANANPDMASAGNSSVPHVAGELFKYMSGVNLVRGGYRGGGPALMDLIAGQVQVMFEPTLSTLPHIIACELRALAVTLPTRQERIADLGGVRMPIVTCRVC